MKILVDGRVLTYKQARGMAVYLKHMLEEISRRDHRNEYLILVGRSPLKVDLNVGKNFRTIRFPSFPGVDEVFSIPLLVRRLKPDAVWFPASVASMFIPRRIRVVTTIHDLIFLRCRERLFSYKWFGALYRKIFVRIAARNSCRIISVSGTVAEQISNKYPFARGKVRVVYSGIPERNCFDDSILKRLSLKPGYYIYSIAGTGLNKNIERLLKALPVFLVRNRRYKFVLTGVSGRETEHQDVVFTGYVTGCEKNSLLKNAALFVLISTDEGFGFPALEAASFGVPLLLADIPVFRELYGEIALFVNPYSAEDICFGMERALENPVSYSIRKVLKEFSWTKAATAVLEELNVSSA